MAQISISDWARKQRLSLDQACRGIKIELFNSVIQDTRVNTGRLRGNWQTSTGQPIEVTIERLDPGGAESSRQVVETVTAFGVDYLTNNLPYAAIWNERDAIIDKNMARIEKIIKNVKDNPGGKWDSSWNGL